MTDYRCPDCQAKLPPGDRQTTCTECDWSGVIGEADREEEENSSPFDVEGKPGAGVGRDSGTVMIYLSKKGVATQVSPTKAENFAEDLVHAARDARCGTNKSSTKKRNRI